MSSTEATHPDPAVVPQDLSAAEKRGVDPVQPPKSLPNAVSAKVTKADELLLRLSKYVEPDIYMSPSLRGC